MPPNASWASRDIECHRCTRPGDLSRTGVASLTERDLQIARLIVDRKANGEIADERFLSKKTIETHIRNMFGSSTRARASTLRGRKRVHALVQLLAGEDTL